MVLALGSLLLNPNEMKHIESIQPEYAAFELDRIGREETDATASAALTALLHNVTGCAIPPTSDTPQSEVEELVPLCLSILRRHWTTPLTALGDGTTPMSLADFMRRLILGRVQGNEALGIPPANADIPTAVAALTKRHIDDGLTLTLTDGTTMPLPDGLSLAQLLCGVSPDGSDFAASVTELKDDNEGWVMTKALPWSTFPNVTKATLNCVDAQSNTGVLPKGLILTFSNLRTCKDINIVPNSPNTTVHVYGLEYLNFRTGNGGIATFWVENLYMHDAKSGVLRIGDNASHNNTTTKYIYLGCKGSPDEQIRVWHNYLVNTSVSDLEIREGTRQSILLNNINGLTAENIALHILDRLADNTDGKTITITIGATNLATIEGDATYAPYLTDARNKNYTIA